MIVGLVSLLASCATTKPSPETQLELEALQARFGISIVTQDVPSVLEAFNSPLRGSSPGSGPLNRYVSWLGEQLSSYPEEAFSCARIDQIVLSSNLRVVGERPRGDRSLSTSGDSRSAFPAASDRALVLDIDTRTNVRYQARVLHHEFFHLLDYSIQGSRSEDPEWAALNPRDFTYGSGGERTSRFIAYFPPLLEEPGFLTAYGTMSLAEDKAELFSLLKTEPELVHRRRANDPFVDAKTRLLISRLNEECPGFALRAMGHSEASPARGQR